MLSGELIVAEHFPKLHFLNLTCGRVGHLLDVLHVVGNPPFSDLTVQEALQLVRRDIALTILHYD